MATYPLPKFYFKVDWKGKRIGFTEVTGLDVQIEAIEYREGSDAQFSKVKMPGMQKFSNITLKRGTVEGDLDFYTWLKTINLNKVERRTVNIMLCNESGNPVLTWQVKNAFPIKLQATDLKADGNEVAIETLELAHEGLEVIPA